MVGAAPSCLPPPAPLGESGDCKGQCELICLYAETLNARTKGITDFTLLDATCASEYIGTPVYLGNTVAANYVNTICEWQCVAPPPAGKGSDAKASIIAAARRAALGAPPPPPPPPPPHDIGIAPV